MSRRALRGRRGSAGTLVELSCCWMTRYSWPSPGCGWGAVTRVVCCGGCYLDAVADKVEGVVCVLGVVHAGLEYVHDQGAVWLVRPPAAKEHEQQHGHGDEQSGAPVGGDGASVALDCFGCVMVP